MTVVTFPLWRGSLAQQVVLPRGDGWQRSLSCLSPCVGEARPSWAPEDLSWSQTLGLYSCTVAYHVTVWTALNIHVWYRINCSVSVLTCHDVMWKDTSRLKWCCFQLSWRVFERESILS